MKPKPNHEYIVRIGNGVDFDGNIPIESVKELVRCKDCRFGIAHKYGIYCPRLAYTRPGDWFCANGERKEGEQDDKG